MDVRFINPFVKAISNVYSTMLSDEVAFGKPVVKTPDSERPDVSAIIGFSCDASGAAILCFRKDVALKTAGRFAGIELTLDHPDFADALGELANMVAGGAKGDFEGLAVSISLPSVIVGEGHEVVRSNVNPSLVIPVRSEFGPFTVEVSMKVEKKAAVGAAP